MSSSGSGTGTPIAPPSFPPAPYDQMEELQYIPNCAVSLSRYAKLISYSEPSFWGVIVENAPQYGCDPLWSENQRMSMQNALAEAQQEIEQQINYPLCPTWIAGTVADEYMHNDRWVDAQIYRSQMLTRYPRLITAGIRAVTTIGAGATVTHGPTVGVIGPLAIVALDTDEIHVYYPNSDREITPSKITISSGTVTIEIPRYRMVVQDFLDFGDAQIRYETLANFLTTVDVKRVYNDPSVNATLVKAHCKNNNCYGGCSECTQTACIYIRDPYIGQIDVYPATWDADALTWNSKIGCYSGYSRARLNYQAGMRYLNLQAEQAIIRLAHVKLGRPPCQCDHTLQIFQQDYEIPSVMTREILNNPFGPWRGAWIAYKWAMSIASKRASIL